MLHGGANVEVEEERVRIQFRKREEEEKEEKTATTAHHILHIQMTGHNIPTPVASSLALGSLVEQGDGLFFPSFGSAISSHRSVMGSFSHCCSTNQYLHTGYLPEPVRRLRRTSSTGWALWATWTVYLDGYLIGSRQ